MIATTLLVQKACAAQPPQPVCHKLIRGLAAWELRFEGQSAVLLHQKGLAFIAWLLAHPEQPIHAVDLIRVDEDFSDPKQRRGHELLNPVEAKTFQQQSLGFERAEVARSLLGRREKLKAILEDEAETEPVKAEAFRELEELDDGLARMRHLTADLATRATESVHKAIRRFYRSLCQAKDFAGAAHPVLVPFAAHLERYCFAPSLKHAAWRSSGGLPAGSFIFVPPPDERWLVR